MALRRWAPIPPELTHHQFWAGGGPMVAHIHVLDVTSLQVHRGYVYRRCVECLTWVPELQRLR